ncbi:MAG: FtsX-like permease family protein, partial [Bacteroidales bacterium]
MGNYLKIIIRILKRNPVFAFVIIGGFSFSLAIVLLLSSYIFSELDFDKSFPEIGRIYRLCTEKGITTFRGDLVKDLKDRYPEIERICRYENGTSELVYNKSPYQVTNLVKTDNDFFKIFSVNILGGNIYDPLPGNNSLAISTSLARVIFGNYDPIGQTINIQHRKVYTVTALFEDLPGNSSINAQAVINWENVNDLGGEWRNGIFYSRLFFLLNRKSDPQKLEKEITQDYMQEHYIKQPFKLLPFRNSYLSPLTASATSETLHADRRSISLFSIVTALILLISILNFIILFISNHLARVKEIGIRKAAGAERKDIFNQFIIESVTISVIAFILAIYLAILFEAPFISLIQKDFPALAALRFPGILFVIPGVILTGVLAGLYPAIIISNFKPATIFGNFSVRGKLRMQSGLSVIQYLISIVLIVSFMVMTRQ